MGNMRSWPSVILLGMVTLTACPSSAAERLRMATTTSTENSGLLGVLNPPFERYNDAAVDVIAVGTGKALRLARNGDVDLVLVHAPEVEKQFVNQGFGIDRQIVMHNDFVLLGPKSDPAGVKNASNIADALKLIGEAKAPFVSRGDGSGTHIKEQAIWEAAGIEPTGAHYLSIGQGMGAALQISDNKKAYTLSDRGTYIAYRARLDLVILHQGDPRLVNPYHVIAVNPERHPHINYQLARRYIDFIAGPQGQTLIAGFRTKGQQLFYPDAIKQP